MNDGRKGGEATSARASPRGIDGDAFIKAADAVWGEDSLCSRHPFTSESTSWCAYLSGRLNFFILRQNWYTLTWAQRGSAKSLVGFGGEQGTPVCWLALHNKGNSLQAALTKHIFYIIFFWCQNYNEYLLCILPATAVNLLWSAWGEGSTD